MIKETKEFKNFAGIVDDSGGNVRNLKKGLAAQQNGGDAIKIDDCTDQTGDWIPDPAYTLAHQFR